jgi:hypothetical protein
MTRFTALLAGLALGAFSLPLLAQDDIALSQPAKYVGRFDVATSTFFPSDVDPDSGPADSNPSVLYDNETTNGYLQAAAANVNNHQMDWGTFTTSNGQGATITELRIGYGTNLTAVQGAPTLRIRIYEGATGLGVQGTVVSDVLVGPLPIGTAVGYSGFTVDVTLATPFTLSDGPIGWSYNVDNPAGAPATSTGPLLVGPPNGPGAGAAHGPAFGSYDRYKETTNAFLGTNNGTTVMQSFVMRLKGRANGTLPSAWQNYGSKNKVTLTADGSATPGSVDNVIHVKCNPAGKDFVLFAGLNQGDFFNAHLGQQFYVFPWLVQLAPITTPALTGAVDLPAALPANVPVNTVFYIQVWAQNLGGQYQNWSEGLQCTVE